MVQKKRGGMSKWLSAGAPGPVWNLFFSRASADGEGVEEMNRFSVTSAVDQQTANRSSPCCSQTFSRNLEYFYLTFLLLKLQMRKNHTTVYRLLFSLTHLQPAGCANSQNHTIKPINGLTEMDGHATALHLFIVLSLYVYFYCCSHFGDGSQTQIWLIVLIVACCDQSATWKRVQRQPAA